MNDHIKIPIFRIKTKCSRGRPVEVFYSHVPIKTGLPFKSLVSVHSSVSKEGGLLWVMSSSRYDVRILENIFKRKLGIEKDIFSYCHVVTDLYVKVIKNKPVIYSGKKPFYRADSLLAGVFYAKGAGSIRFVIKDHSNFSRFILNELEG